MWPTRDLTFVIILAVLSFIYSIFIGQLGNLFTGIMGFNYLFTFGHVIFISYGFLVYNGRRWRFFLQSAIVALLMIPTFAGGNPFDALARTPILINAFVVDLLCNSIHKFFKNRNRIFLWAILSSTIFWLLNPFFYSLNMYLFYPRAMLNAYINIIVLLLPIIVIEALFGGYLGYEIFRRTDKLLK